MWLSEVFILRPFLPGLCSHKALCSPVMMWSQLFHLQRWMHRLLLFSLQGGGGNKKEIPSTETKSSVAYKSMGSYARLHKYKAFCSLPAWRCTHIEKLLWAVGKSCTKTVPHWWDDNTPIELCGRSETSFSLRLGKRFPLVKHNPSHPRRETLIKMV